MRQNDASKLRRRYNSVDCAFSAGLFMLSAIVACWLVAAEGSPPDAVVIAPREFLAALQPWVEHRQQQGHRLAYIASGGTAPEIRATVRKAAASGGLKYVLIV